MKSNRVGEENYNAYGTLMKIVEYKNSKNIIIEFQDEYKYRKKCLYKDFKNGIVKNPYDKTIFNMGCIGIGKYKNSINGKNTKIYDIWHSMMKRCYDPYYINKEPTYADCFVCEEWLNFQRFAKWCEENYYEVEDKKMHLDKDILYKGNKIYSPKTCVFVPQRINQLFVKPNKRKKTLIGVNWREDRGKFYSYCSIIEENGKYKSVYLGSYVTENEAFYEYKKFKENYIKQIANEYKNLIPSELYEAMYSWEVEIND